MAKRVKVEKGGVMNQFEPGESGNPKGRPKGSKSFKKILKDLLEGKTTISDELGERVVTRKEAAALLLVKAAIDETNDVYARMKAVVIIMERLEGKPATKSELTGKGGQPLIPQAAFMPSAINVTVTGIDKSKEEK